MTGDQSGAAQSTTATSILESVQDSNLRLGIQTNIQLDLHWFFEISIRTGKKSVSLY